MTLLNWETRYETFLQVLFQIKRHVKLILSKYTFEPPRDKTNNVAVRPAKTQISLGIRPVWPESSMCAQLVARDPSFLHADNEDSDQTGRMPRLIWVFAGRTCHFVGFVMRRLILLARFVLRDWLACMALCFEGLSLSVRLPTFHKLP